MSTGILLTRFPLESRFGGAEAQTLSLMKGLKERGHEVRFLGSCPVLLERCQVSGVRSQEAHIGPPPVTEWEAVSFLWRRKRMRGKLVEAIENAKTKKYENTKILMLSLSEKLLVTDWCVEQGMKVFWIEHDRVGRWLTCNPWLPRLRRLSRLATTVVVSNLSREIYLTLGWPEERTMTIPNGIDLQRFSPNPNPNPNPGFLRIGCIARLTHDKGVDLLIEAVKGLPDIHLTIIGAGREETALRSLLKKNLPTANCKLQNSHNAIAEFYHSIDVLVLPSRAHDPFGLVVAEAMASGVPTICTDACGIAAHLSGEDAMIVPAGNVEALRNAIATVRENEVWERLAERGPHVARERFSKERMVGAYEALLY